MARPSLPTLLATFFTSLLVMSLWLVPPEGATDGSQAWRAFAWMAVALLWTLSPGDAEATNGGESRGRRRWADLAVGLLVVGHLASGFLVLATHGNRNAAAILLVEWMGVGAAWLALRAMVARPKLLPGLAIMFQAGAVAISLFGLWQHFVELPELSRELGPKIAELRRALEVGAGSPFASELAAAGVPTTEPGLTLFEKRLINSREPFGFFGLANTLAGILVAAMVWGLGNAIKNCRAARWNARMFWLACGLTVLACVAVTKSRTATVGLLCGGLLVILASLPVSVIGRWRTRRVALGTAATCLGVIGLVGFLFATGVWDRQVLTEAPKSLAYRGQYWRASLELVRRSPVMGVGLGQFRTAYLQVKLPEASEEIADPHNALLDAWLNGGLGAALGVVMLAAVLLWSLRRSAAGSSVSSDEDLVKPSSDRGTIVVVAGATAAFLLEIGSAILGRSAWDDRVPVVGALWALLVVCWVFLGSSQERPSRQGAVAAGLALVVHLLGSGGMGMSGVICVLLVLLAIATEDSAVPPPSAMRGTQQVGLIVVGIMMLVVMAIAGLIHRPVAISAMLVAKGDEALRKGQTDRARDTFQDALTANSWDAAPALRLAGMDSQRQRSDSSSTEARQSVESTLKWLAVAGDRDPFNPEIPRMAGNELLNFARRNRDDSAAREAAVQLAKAWARYPTNSVIAAEWSDAATIAGDRIEAGEAARKALVQDEIYRQQGHVDRYLSDPRRAELQSRCESAGENR